MTSTLTEGHPIAVSAEEPVREPAARQRKPGCGPKTLQLIRLVSDRAGADAAAIGRKLGWQPHSTRAAIAGLRKAGFSIAFEKGADGKPGRYRLIAVPVTGEGS